MKRSETGQTLLIAICILLVLFISIPSIIFINNMGIRHQTQSQKRSQGQAIAEEGIAYAAAQLSDTDAIWKRAMGNIFNAPQSVVTMCGSSGAGTNIPNTQFRISCGIDPTRPNEVSIVSTAWLPGPDGQLIAAKSLQVFLNQRTLGASLADGTRASAALELVKVPSPPFPPGFLTVEWGPVVCLDNAVWTLSDPFDHQTAGPATFQGTPRKFSAGGIKGNGGFPDYRRNQDQSVSSIPTDQKEYWAFASLGFPATISEYDYVSNTGLPIYADKNTGMPPPSCLGSGCTQNPPGSGHYGAGPSTILFDNAYAAAVPNNAVIYIDGDAQFKNLSFLDLTNGALIVNGNLTLLTPGAGASPTLKIPSKAPQEYPYWPTSNPAAQWPCAAQCTPSPPTGTGITWKDAPPTCTAINPTCARAVNFRGFLWVKKNLTVTGPGAWVFSGSVLVGDISTLPVPTGQLVDGGGGGSLTIYYDDQINHTIRVNPR